MKPGWRRIGAIALGAVAVALTAGALFLGPYAARVRRFEPLPQNGYHAVFYVYVSPDARRAAAEGKSVTLLVQPNNSGTNSDDVNVHRRDAWWTGFERHRIANDLGVVLLVPAFVRPATDWKIYTHALDRDVLTTTRRDYGRLDLQLIAMVDEARKALAADGIRVEEKFLIQGYSASGMFANRFAALHPDRVLAVAAGSPGGWPIAPLSEWKGERLPYPAGVADLGELTGRPFDSVTYKSVPQLIVMGSVDDNDAVGFGDGWDESASEQVDRLFGDTPVARWDDAEAVYRAAGADARFLLVEGVGHDRVKLQGHTVEFFREILNRR